MGYMTTITILNDGWDQIKKNPEKFVENISEGMHGIKRRVGGGIDRQAISTFGLGNHCNLMDVAVSHHADDARMYVTWANTMNIVGWGNDSEHLKHRKDVLAIAKQMIKREEEEIKRMEKEQEQKKTPL